MLKEVSFIEEWIQEGEARGARQMLLRQLQKRFGELSAAAVARLEAADLAACEALAEQVLEANSLAELGLAGDGNEG